MCRQIYVTQSVRRNCTFPFRVRQGWASLPVDDGACLCLIVWEQNPGRLPHRRAECCFLDVAGQAIDDDRYQDVSCRAHGDLFRIIETGSHRASRKTLQNPEVAVPAAEVPSHTV